MLCSLCTVCAVVLDAISVLVINCDPSCDRALIYVVSEKCAVPCLTGGRVQGSGCGEGIEDRTGAGGLHQQEGGEADSDDCGLWRHSVRGSSANRKAAEGNR